MTLRDTELYYEDTGEPFEYKPVPWDSVFPGLGAWHVDTDGGPVYPHEMIERGLTLRQPKKAPRRSKRRRRSDAA